MTTAHTRLDTHLHLWDPALGVYSWLQPDLGPLYAAFTPAAAAAELGAAGVDRAVLVQAADSAADTQAMLDVAAAHDWVAGVIGWLDLEDTDGAAAEVDKWTASPYLCGVRQLIHDDPRDDVLDLPSVRATLAALAAHGVPLDVPDAFPSQIHGAVSAATEVDGLVVVIDHLAKPPRDTPAMVAWEDQLREAARRDRVVAKVSGLELAEHPWSVDAIRPVWETALDAFGTRRLMFGSDWPMSVAGGGYRATLDVIGQLIDELSPDEQADLWWRTGSRVYQLGPDPESTG